MARPKYPNIVKLIIKVIKEYKGDSVKAINISKLDNYICKYVIVCTSNSNIQLDTIQSKIIKTLSKQMGQKPFSVENDDQRTWCLMDYVDVIVHIFDREKREYYDIEGFCKDLLAKSVNKIVE